MGGDRIHCTPSPLYMQTEVSNPASCQHSRGTSDREQHGQESRSGVAQEPASPSEMSVQASLSPAPKGMLLLSPSLSSEHRPGVAFGKVTRCVPAAYGLRKQVLVAPHRGLAQRHTKGREPGGCAVISSLVTGSLSLPQCLIAACSLWQYSWCIQVPPQFRAGREEFPDPHQGVTCHQAAAKTRRQRKMGNDDCPPFFRKGGDQKGTTTQPF